MIRYVKNVGTMCLPCFDVGHHPKGMLSTRWKKTLRRLWWEMTAGFVMHACLRMCWMAIGQPVFAL